MTKAKLQSIELDQLDNVRGGFGLLGGLFGGLQNRFQQGDATQGPAGGLAAARPPTPGGGGG